MLLGRRKSEYIQKRSIGSHLNERIVRGEMEEWYNESKELSDFGSDNEAPEYQYPVNVSDLRTDNQKFANLSEADRLM